MRICICFATCSKKSLELDKVWWQWASQTAAHPWVTGDSRTSAPTTGHGHCLEAGWSARHDGHSNRRDKHGVTCCCCCCFKFGSVGRARIHRVCGVARRADGRPRAAVGRGRRRGCAGAPRRKCPPVGVGQGAHAWRAEGADSAGRVCDCAAAPAPAAGCTCCYSCYYDSCCRSCCGSACCRRHDGAAH